MANTRTFEKGPQADPWMLGVKCATAVTDVRLAYKFLTTDNETVELCGDNDAIAGFPDRLAAIGETFNLRMAGHIIGLTSGAGVLAINDPITSGASGTLRKAVIGTDFVQGFAESPTAATANLPLTIRKGA